MNETIVNFLENIRQSFEAGTLVKITLAKPRSKSAELKNIYVRPVELKKGLMLSFTYRYQTKDEVKNYTIDEALELISGFLGGKFMRLHLFTTEQDFELSINKKGNGFVRTSEPAFTEAVIQTHDHQKKRWVDPQAFYLHRLEITDARGKVRPSKNDKFKQINKYIEIVDALIDQLAENEELQIVDMGSGKGYLTFALYDFLKNIKKRDAKITGVEMRPDLVELCNQIARESKFEKLGFEKGSIIDFDLQQTDVLIALHACDTATDDAIFKGIRAEAGLIICAPCCHKQIRKEISASANEIPMLKYGILLERQAEMITDTIRALILEKHGYESNVFEFISSEHTGKNLMIAAVKLNKEIDKENIQSKIDGLKQQYGITTHYLEKLLIEPGRAEQ